MGKSRCAALVSVPREGASALSRSESAETCGLKRVDTVFRFLIYTHNYNYKYKLINKNKPVRRQASRHTGFTHGRRPNRFQIGNIGLYNYTTIYSN